jgi:hypothetical protein
LKAAASIFRRKYNVTLYREVTDGVAPKGGVFVEDASVHQIDVALRVRFPSDSLSRYDTPDKKKALLKTALHFEAHGMLSNFEGMVKPEDVAMCVLHMGLRVSDLFMSSLVVDIFQDPLLDDYQKTSVLAKMNRRINSIVGAVSSHAALTVKPKKKGTYVRTYSLV